MRRGPPAPPSFFPGPARLAGVGVLLLGLALASWPARGATVAAQDTDPAAWYCPQTVLLPLGGSDLGGHVRLRPTGASDFVLDPFVVGAKPDGRIAYVVPRGQPAGRALAAALAPGTCAEWAARAAAALGTGETEEPEEPDPSRDDVLFSSWSEQFRPLRVPAAWVGGPAVYLLAEDGGRGPLAGCADLPTATARLLEPDPETEATAAPLQPVAPWHVGGTVLLWSTPSANVLLQAEVNGPPEELTRSIPVTWLVGEDTCSTWIAASAQRSNGGEVLARGFGGPIDVPGQHDFSLVVPQLQAAGGPLALVAFVSGGGPLVACAELPR